MKKTVMSMIFMGLFATIVYAAKAMESYQSVEINAPASEVWAVLVDPDNWAHDNPVVVKAELVQGDGESVGSVIKCKLIVGGRKARPKLIISISEKNKKLEYTVKMPGVQSIMGFTLEEKNGVTKLTNYEIASGPILKFITQEEMDQEHLDWVVAVKKRIESQ